MPALYSLSIFLIASRDWAVLGACLALAVATMLFVFYIQPDASDLAPHRTKLDQLLERRDTIYDNLRDLRFEYRSGKYSEGDFEAMKTALENEAAVVLAEIDQVTDAQVRAEGVYKGTSSRWVDANVSREAAEAHLDEMFGEDRCSICGKRPDEVDSFAQRGSVRICNYCAG